MLVPMDNADAAAATSGRGRPRNQAIDDAVLSSARALLAEQGYPAATIAAIARRANVGTAAIYRRWPHREALIEDAIFGSAEEVDLPRATKDLRADMLAWSAMFLRRMAEPSTRAAVPGLLANYQQHPDAYDVLRQRADLPVRAAFVERIKTVIPAEAADADETAILVFEVMVSRAFARGLTHGLVDADEYCRRTADALVALIQSGA